MSGDEIGRVSHPFAPPQCLNLQLVNSLMLCARSSLNLQAVPSNNSPYADLPPIFAALFEAKARKGKAHPNSICSCSEQFAGLSFEDVAKAIGRDEVWVAAAFYGQVRPSSLTFCTTPNEPIRLSS